MTKKNQHVVPHKDGWAVKGAGNEKATAIHPTQPNMATKATTHLELRPIVGSLAVSKRPLSPVAERVHAVHSRFLVSIGTNCVRKLR